MEELPLPPEVWVYVFSFLSTEEKYTLSTCCRSLKKLVDHPSLWRHHHTVVLSDLRRYTHGFWETLRHRKLTRIAVGHLRRKDWRRLLKYLPSLTAIVFTGGDRTRLYKEKYLDYLSRFPDLRDLGLRNSICYQAMLGRTLNGQLREQLTHLSVCNVQLLCTVDFINTVSHLVNLRYLLFHQQEEVCGLDTERPVPRGVFHNLLLSLKKLKHLSWGMRGEQLEPLPDDYLSPPELQQPGSSHYDGLVLTNLELVDYSETILPKNALRSLTSLRSLTVRYRYIREGIKCRLTSWLSPLQQLETLTIIGGNSLATYTTTIPSSVTNLTLRVAITLKDMDSIAPKVPALKHLDIEQNRSSGSLCKRIPMLFPQLRTLRIRFFRREPEKDLLSLHRLRHLVQLELLVERSFILRDYLDGHPWPSPCVQELIQQLRELSKNRITIITTMRQRCWGKLRISCIQLNVCNVQLLCTVDFINTVSHLVNLRYLLFHQQEEVCGLDTERPVPRGVFHNLLLSLKKLKHLSWGMRGEQLEPLPDDYLSLSEPQQPGSSHYYGLVLTNLELVDYLETILPKNALRSLTSLRSLTVRYR